MSNIHALHHCAVLVADTARALAFYHDLLGLALDSSRPDLGYPGAWLSVGDSQVHLMELPNPDPVTDRPEHAGRDRHLALAVRDLEPIQQALERAGVACTLSRSGRRALFCRDPDGNGVEIVESNL